MKGFYVSYSMRYLYSLLIFSTVLISCGQPENSQVLPQKIKDSFPISDPHSYATLSAARIVDMNLDIKVDFEKHIVSGSVEYRIQSNGADTIFFDSSDLLIDSITSGNKKLAFTMGKKDKYMGRSIAVPIDTNQKIITLYYSSSPKASALQWLEPAQTASRTMPFLYTQGEAILTRSWIPIQDSPGIRFPYKAKVAVPPGMLALMSADNPQEKSTDGQYTFEMDLPVPAYLIALAAGDLSFKELDNRTGVYADPTVVKAAAEEFSETPAMIKAAEHLYGPYIWGRYDILILPPAFPYGGMENPRLTFATPTVIAGDKSLASLVAHELAHSWSGNLVTNGTWNDFWLNEGFTVYLERRISEVVKGKDYAEMSAMIGRGDLDVALEDFKNTPALTKLKLNLKGKDPDDGMSDVAYEKGYLLLVLLERSFGRDSLDHFLKNWFIQYKFKPVNTEMFESQLYSSFPPAKLDSLQIKSWLYKPGLPGNAPKFTNKLFHTVDSTFEKVLVGKLTLKYNDWNFNQWLYFLRKLDGKVSLKQLNRMDEAYKFSGSGNYEILYQWLIDNINLKNNSILPDVANFLSHVGRRKFVLPMYEALLRNGMRPTAELIFRNSKANYHFITANSVEELFKSSSVD